MKFKDNLREQRNLAHLSQESLADQMSVSRQTVSKWENGDTYPSTKHIFMLAKILNCNFDSLVNPEPNCNTGNPISQGSHCDTVSPESSNDNNAEQPANQPKPPIYKKCLYWLTGTITALFIVALGLGLSICLNSTGPNPHSTINNSKLLVFDKILDGTLDDATNTFAKDGFTKTKVVGYGVTGDDCFFIKYDLVNCDSGEPCSAIIYFDEQDGNYIYKCQYLDDPDFVPGGEYHKVG